MLALNCGKIWSAEAQTFSAIAGDGHLAASFKGRFGAELGA